MEFVRETPRGLIFPKNIAQQRGSRALWANSTAIVVLISVAVFLTNKNKIIYLMSSISSMLLMMFIVELLNRLCQLTEERCHLKSRYNNSLQELLEFVFYFHSSRWIVFFSALIVFLIIFFIEHTFPLWIIIDSYSSIVFCFSCTLLFERVFNFSDGPLKESLQVNGLQGLDYGSGMAHSFFHGYLRIVLPTRGTSDKGLSEFLQDYESQNNITFDVKKLFLLIPMSLHCPSRLDSEFSSSIERSKELESINIDRAGVSKRNYKNSVYKINTENGSKKYVSAEYATPVKTLKEVMTANNPHSNLYSRHRRELTLNFYLTLKNLIKNDPDCCNVCEVIYFNDLDEYGNFIDVGTIILRRMFEILQMNKKNKAELHKVF